MSRLPQFLAKWFRNPAAIALGMLGVLGGIRVFFDPTSSPVALEMPTVVAWAWGALYAFGGIGIIRGVVQDLPKHEAAGWTMFAGGAAVQAIATISLLDKAAFLSWYSIITLGAFALFAYVKAYLLRCGYRLMWFKPVNEEEQDG